MRNKKAVGGLEWYILVIAAFLGVGAFYLSYLESHKIIENYIGQYQFQIMEAENKAENSLLYVTQSAKYSLEQSIYDLAKNGGTSEADKTEIFEQFEEIPKPDKCGIQSGYAVWYDVRIENGTQKKTSCFDENYLGIHLEHFFNKHLNEYILKSPVNLLLDNYNYLIKDNLEITGMAASPLEFEIYKTRRDEEIKIKSQQETPLNILFENPKEVVENVEVVDFTNTPLCAKGVRCRLTFDALNLLARAQDIAKKEGISLEATSTYRSYEQQLALWEGRTPERYAQRYPDPNIRRRYVSNPADCGNSCPHATGKVVDLRFKGKTFSTMTYDDWKKLESIMADAGWVRYANENWHFECCGTARYARAKELERSTGERVKVIV